MNDVFKYFLSCLRCYLYSVYIEQGIRASFHLNNVFRSISSFDLQSAKTYNTDEASRGAYFKLPDDCVTDNEAERCDLVFHCFLYNCLAGQDWAVQLSRSCAVFRLVLIFASNWFII